MRTALSAGLLLLATTTSTVAGEALFRHPEAIYPPLSLSWQPVPGVDACERIWPHPLLPGVVALTGERGLQISTDGGLTWTAAAGLPAGAVGGIAFHPSEPDESLVATPAGLWRRQGKRAYTRLAIKDLPPPTGVWYHARDPLGQTILVTHGDQAFGLTVSSDGGTTWKQLLPDYHVYRILPSAIGEKSLTMLVSPGGDATLRTLLCLANLDERPLEVRRDSAVTDSANPVQIGKLHLVSPRDGLQRLTVPRDHSIGDAEPVAVAQASSDGFTAIDFCWGATVDRQLLFLFDPFTLGVIYSAGGDTWYPAGTGLPVGAMVKEGAQFRANANGSRFFAIINDRVFVGRPVDLRLDGLRLQAEPPVALVQVTRYAQRVNDLGRGLMNLNRVGDPLPAARALREVLDGLDAAVQPATIRLRATLAAGAVPQRLTVDLTRFGRSAVEPLYDDGKHDDGAAGDGHWTAEVRIRPSRLSPEAKEWRRTPGILGLSVTAHWQDGTCSGAVAPLLAWSVTEQLSLADRIKPEESLIIDGLTMSVDKPAPGAQGPELRFTAKGGPWQLTLRFNCVPRHRLNDMDAYIDMEPFAELGFDWGGGAASIRILDLPTYDEPNPSDEIDLAGDLVGKSDAEGWRPVTVPVASLVKADSAFNRGRLAAFILSGNAKPGEVFRLRSPRLLPGAEP